MERGWRAMSEAGAQNSTGRERYATWAGVGLLVLLAVGWGWSIANSRTHSTVADAEVAGSSTAGAIAAALTNRDAPSAAYLTNAALDLITARMIRSQLGTSGKLRATFKTSGGIVADSLPSGGELRYKSGADQTTQPTHPGLWGL